MDQRSNNLINSDEAQLSTFVWNNRIQGGGGTDRTESDATHFRLREEREHNNDWEVTTCISCNRKFEVKSITDLYQHYTDVEHNNSFGNCLYCKGKVHQYYRGVLEKGNVKIFHDCLRWRRGEFK